MVRIAIVDDDKIACIKLKSELIRYSIWNDQDYYIDTYFNCESAISNLKLENGYDIIFLDIEFNNMMNGIQLGDFLRNKMLNVETSIIFISSIEEYAKQLFKIHPFDFLIKPVSYEKIENCLNSYFKMNYLKNKYFKFMKNKSEHEISVNQIKYLQSDSKKIIIHTNNENIEFYGRLSNYINEKCFENFIIIHKSFFVNPLYIERFGYNYVIVKDNINLPISRKYQDIVRERLMDI